MDSRFFVKVAVTAAIVAVALGLWDNVLYDVVFPPENTTTQTTEGI